MKITTKQFQLLTDINLVWDFMVETYDRENDCGRAAPFFEYAITSSWMDTSYSFLDRLCWYGFGHGERGDFVDWDKYDDSLEWTPAKSHKSSLSRILSPSPHDSSQYNIVIADKDEEYVCFSGMWWVPQNQLAYMEPLCTHPDHRKKGLASAALSLHYKRMKALGASHMTGGGDPFYQKLGYGKGYHCTIWRKDGN